MTSVESDDSLRWVRDTLEHYTNVRMCGSLPVNFCDCGTGNCALGVLRPLGRRCAAVKCANRCW